MLVVGGSVGKLVDGERVGETVVGLEVGDGVGAPCRNIVSHPPPRELKY